MKKIIKGLISGGLGLEIFDSNKNGKTTWAEIRGASADQWIRFAVSTVTTILSILFLS